MQRIAILYAISLSLLRSICVWSVCSVTDSPHSRSLLSPLNFAQKSVHVVYFTFASREALFMVEVRSASIPIVLYISCSRLSLYIECQSHSYLYMYHNLRITTQNPKRSFLYQPLLAHLTLTNIPSSNLALVRRSSTVLLLLLLMQYIRTTLLYVIASYIDCLQSSCLG